MKKLTITEPEPQSLRLLLCLRGVLYCRRVTRRHDGIPRLLIKRPEPRFRQRRSRPGRRHAGGDVTNDAEQAEAETVGSPCSGAQVVAHQLQ